MSPAPVTRKSAAAAALVQRILTLELAPGADLDEARLSAEFDLSRTPMREVLRDLAGEGYVQLRENKGARVSEMGHTTLRDFFVAAPMIYGAVLQLAALHHTPAQMVELRHAQARFKDTLRGPNTAARAMANDRFHAITGDMASNVYLRPSFQRLLIDHARISMTFYRPGDPDMAATVNTASDQHDAIIAAIAAHDAAAAAQLAIDHWQLSRDQIENYVMPSGLDLPLGQLPQTAEQRTK